MIRKSVQNLEPYTPGEQPKIANIIKLNTNENAYPPSPKVLEVMRNFDLNTLNLYPDPLCTEIREIIASQAGCGIENVFVGNGSDEVLRLATYAYVEDDDTIGYFSPSYSLYPVLTAIRAIESTVLPLPTDEELPCALDKAELSKKPALFFVANPNAPTSTLFSPEQMRNFCKRNSGVVLIDEAYGAFAEKDCIELALSMPNVVVCRTMSKAWSLAGIRLGYLIGPADLIEAIYKIKDSYNVNALTQQVAKAALSDPEWMNANREKIIATRTHIINELRKLGWECEDSATNFIWCSPPPPETAESVKNTLRRHGIIVRYFPGAQTGNYLRITVGTDKQMDALLEVLKMKGQE